MISGSPYATIMLEVDVHLESEHDEHGWAHYFAIRDVRPAYGALGADPQALQDLLGKGGDEDIDPDARLEAAVRSALEQIRDAHIEQGRILTDEPSDG